MGSKISLSSKPVVFAIFTGVISGSSFAVFWYFYERINRATRLDNLRETNYNIEQLNTAIDVLRKEIEELKAVKSSKSDLNNGLSDEDSKSKKSFKMVRFKNTLSYMSSASDTDYQSAWSDNETSSNEEFFDFPENELLGEQDHSK